MEELELANILYNYCLDMDYADYIEYADQEIQNLADEIKTAKEMTIVLKISNGVAPRKILITPSRKNMLLEIKRLDDMLVNLSINN